MSNLLAAPSFPEASVVVPYSAGTYIIPAVTSSNATNGANFRAAYTAAAALTPGGAALSATNRACVMLLPGTYDWTALDNFTALAFVDIAGISGNRSDVQLVGGWATTSVNYNVSNLTAGANAFTGGGGNFSGIATNCTGGTNSFAGGGIFSGTAINCAGGEGAFGGVTVFSGTATNCVGGDYAFGGLFGTFSGTATGCKAGEYSYGGGGTFSGIATNCTAGDSSFAGPGGTFSGTATGCTGGGASFGGYGTFSGTATGCTGGEGCFTGEGGVFTGTPRITDCVADASSFGASFGTPVDFSGATSVLVKDCRLITGLFTNLDAKYKVRSCLNDDLTEANFN